MSIRFQSSFKSWDNEEKPREKLGKYGVESLALWELIALVLRTGERHKGGVFEDVYQLSQRLISEAGFRGLFLKSSVKNFQENFGIHKGHAEILVAIGEILRRVHGRFDIFDVSTPDRVATRFDFLKKVKQEHCYVIHVDDKARGIFETCLGIGGGDSVQVNFTDVLRDAVWLGRREIIVVHNHLGKSAPSDEDMEWTLKLAHGAWKLHKIKLRDHVIVGREADDYFSFLEGGIL
jgi:DNA repair protein RadC